MADFVAVLKKTLDNLGETTPEVRARVYDKARSTIAAKLAAISPPPPSSVADRQKRALEDAISSVERDYARSVPASDPLAELEHIFSSIDRNKNQPSRRGPPTQIEPAWQPPLPTPEMPEPPAVIDVEEQLSKFDLGDLEKFIDAKRPNKLGVESSLGPSVNTAGLASTIQVLTDTFSTGLNRRVRRLLRMKPPEPSIPDGPNFELRGSKLAGSHSTPAANEIGSQRELHLQLRKAIAQAEPMLSKAANKFPELVDAYREYSRLVEGETAALDVVSLWAVGGAMLSFADAYREQNRDRTLSEPLEPQTAGFLQNITRLHGAFIMGFEASRDLVLKADEFLLNRKVLESIAEPGGILLSVFSRDKNLIEPQTLRINKPINDYVHEFGWGTSRTGYSAYIIVRNLLYVLVKLSVGTELNANNVASAALVASAIAGDPNAEFLKAAIPVLQLHAANILAFANHSPEFRAYVEWALSVLAADNEGRG